MDKFRTWLKAERGRASRLAEQLDMTPGAISLWTRIPAERMVAVSHITGIPIEELRPDLFAEPAE